MKDKKMRYNVKYTRTGSYGQTVKTQMNVMAETHFEAEVAVRDFDPNVISVESVKRIS